jgi:hypothetical protein
VHHAKKRLNREVSASVRIQLHLFYFLFSLPDKIRLNLKIRIHELSRKVEENSSDNNISKFGRKETK